MKRTSIIIDYSNISLRALFTCQYMETQVKFSSFASDAERDVLARKITMDICSVIRAWSPDRVILACDAKNPWRDKLYEEIPGESYKGTRQKDETKNWKKIYETVDYLKDVYRSRDFVVSEIPNAEADDLAALWKERCFSEGDNVILVSSDHDWLQLVGKGADGNVCIGYNPITNNKGMRKVYINAEIESWLQEKDNVDIFFTNYNVTKKTINDFVNNDPKVEFEIISPEQILIDKIMCGDDGDNVPAIFSYYKDGRRIRVTPLKSKKILEKVGVSTMDGIIASAETDALLSSISEIMKYDVECDMHARVMRQRRLVELNSTLFPDKIREQFNEHLDLVKGAGYIPLANCNLETVLKGTRYIDENYKRAKRKENSIFDDFKSLGKFSKDPGLF